MQQRLPVSSVDRASSRFLHALAALGFLVGTAAVGVAACGGDQTGSTSTGTSATSGSTTGGTSTGGDCVGGVVINGKCEAKCTPDKCLEMNTCVNNGCALKCTSHLDCNAGTQDCLPGKEDDTGTDVMVCTE